MQTSYCWAQVGDVSCHTDKEDVPDCFVAISPSVSAQSEYCPLRDLTREHIWPLDQKNGRNGISTGLL